MSAGPPKVKPASLRPRLLPQAQCDTAGVRLEPFRLGKDNRGGSHVRQSGGVDGDPCGSLEEVMDGKARCKSGGSPGGQHVVRTGDVVAHRFGAVSAEEDRAGMADAAEHRLPGRAA